MFSWRKMLKIGTLFANVEFAYNNSINRSTYKSSFEIVYGFLPINPLIFFICILIIAHLIMPKFLLKISIICILRLDEKLFWVMILINLLLMCIVSIQNLMKEIKLWFTFVLNAILNMLLKSYIFELLGLTLLFDSNAYLLDLPSNVSISPVSMLHIYSLTEAYSSFQFCLLLFCQACLPLRFLVLLPPL